MMEMRMSRKLVPKAKKEIGWNINGEIVEDSNANITACKVTIWIGLILTQYSVQ